ncbi:MAG: ABC transporter ATP-binding protein [Acidimicrobiales bacterium]
MGSLLEIETRGLTKSFTGRVALDDVTLGVAPGELCGVVGADGAGKTTLLRCVAGLYRPDRGEVVPGRRGRARVGVSPQGFHLYADLTVDENLAFFGTVHGLDRATLRERGGELLRFASLEEHRERLAGNLSGGMQQKLTLVCSVLHRPPILLLDEPTTGVDPVSRREFWHLLDALHRDGTTILLASAYVDEVERCDHVLFLHEGRLLIDGTLDELVPEGATLEAVLRQRMSRADPRASGGDA